MEGARPQKPQASAVTSSPEDEDIELQYSPTFWTKKFPEDEVLENYFSVTRKHTEIAKKTIPCELMISYGPSDAQKVDIFGAKDLPDDAPILVFVHGGSWTFGSREDHGHFVKPFYDAGVVSFVLGYDVVSETITIPDMVKEVIEGFKFVLEYASSRKSKGVYICGHSAGGHLSTMALSTGSFDKDKISLVKAVFLLGALYELQPLLKHSISKDARITKKIADTCSPITLIDKFASNLNPSTKIVVVSCEQESPAFQNQSITYEEKLRSVGMNSEFLMLEDEDHFTIGSRLWEPDFVLTKGILETMEST